MTTTKKLGPRWAGTSKKQRTEHMRALARGRMRKLSRSARVRIAQDMVAARRKKHDQANHT